MLISFIVISCNFNKIYQNREKDKKEAEKVTNKFYSLINQNNKQEVFKLFGSDFFKVTSKNQLIQMLDTINKDCGGSLKKTRVIKWETFISEGTDSKSQYILLYNIERNIKNTEEKITLLKINDSIKIVGYEVKAILSVK